MVNNTYNIKKGILILFATYILKSCCIAFKMYKDYNKKIKLNIEDSNKIKSLINSYDIKRIKNMKNGIKILKFKNKLINYLDKDIKLYNLNNNLKTLNCKSKIVFPANFLLIPVGGSYNPKKNNIKLLKIVESKTINHELLHMASSNYDKEKNLYNVDLFREKE